MKSTWIKMLLTLLLLATGSAAAYEQYPARCRTTTSLNVRSGPAKNYSRLGTLRQGEYITVDHIVGSGVDVWGNVTYNNRQGYVCMRYVSYVSAIAPTPVQPVKASHSSIGNGIEKFFGKAWKVIKSILIILAIALVLLFWEYLIELAVYAGFFAGAGAILFAIFGGSGGTGAIVGLAVAALMGLRLLVNRLDIEFSGIVRTVFFGGYYILSLPIYWLNQLEHFLVEPWRYLFRSDWVSDSVKPTLRVVFEVLSVLLYIAITPLRLFNATVYNLLIHCVTGLYDLFFEVLVPCDRKEGAGNTGRWIVMFPWRLLKYPIAHGVLTIVESVLWTVIDIFVPARTLYHGTNLDACNSIASDPYRNKYLQNTSVWSSGNFLASSHPQCSWAGRGVYFAINRKLALGYSQRAAELTSAPVMIACRVSMGRVINYTLTPSWVYNQTGDGGRHEELNKFGDRYKYTTGEWYNNRHHWEYCLFDWKNGYNHPWRIRPIYVINLQTGLAQHIKGGMQHWLFDRTVLKTGL